jgi:hypothetical protein
MQEQKHVVITNFSGAKVAIAPDALVDYTKWRLTHLQALAGLLAGQDLSCNAVNEHVLELNRALVDEVCDLVPLVLKQR